MHLASASWGKRWLPKVKGGEIAGREGTLSAFTSEQPSDAEGVRSPGNIAEVGGLHPEEHFLRGGKACDRCGQIGIRTLDAGDQATDFRKHGFEVQVVELSQQSRGLAAFQNSDLSSRAKYSANFPQACVIVSKITEAES